MRLRRLAPAAAPLSERDLWWATLGLFRPEPARARAIRDLSQALGVRRVFLLSSGRAALTVILRALVRLSPRKVVILPAYTCFSVPAAVVKAGLEIRLCDIDPATLDFDFKQLQVLIEETNPLCVVSTHLFGLQADVARALSLCSPSGVFVIDDAAQAFGTVAGGRPLGTLGDVGIFSFGRGKPVTSVHGGAIATNSEDIARELELECRSLSSPGWFEELALLVQAFVLLAFLRPSLYWLPASLPFLRLGETSYSTEFSLERMAGPAAGLLRNFSGRLTRANKARVDRMDLLRLGVPSLRHMGSLPAIRLPIVCGSEEERDRLLEKSNDRGLGFSRMYPTSVDGIPELGPSSMSYPNAQHIAQRLLTVPVHPLMSQSDRKEIEAILNDADLDGEDQ